MFANRAGLAGRVPFLSRVLPGGGTPTTAPGGSVLSVEGVGWELLSARPVPAGDDVLLHFREVRGLSAPLTITAGSRAPSPLEVRAANALGDVVSTHEPPTGFASRFFLVRLSGEEKDPERD